LITTILYPAAGIVSGTTDPAGCVYLWKRRLSSAKDWMMYQKWLISTGWSILHLDKFKQESGIGSCFFVNAHNYKRYIDAIQTAVKNSGY